MTAEDDPRIYRKTLIWRGKQEKLLLQALEKEDKVKVATLGNIVDSKLSGLVRKLYNKANLQMSKLAKKVIDLEKLQNKGTRVVEGVQERRSRKKAKRHQTRKEKVLFQQKKPNINSSREQLW